MSNFVSRGSYDETNIKAQKLFAIINGEASFISKDEAIDLLLDMKGGAADIYSVSLLALDIEKSTLEKILTSISNMYLISKEAFDKAVELSKSNDYAKKLLELWANASWEDDENFENVRELNVIKVGDNISTDHLSPGKRANSRTDKPVHAKYFTMTGN